LLLTFMPPLAHIHAAGGRRAAPQEATLILSEVRIDQPGSDLDEYFEIAGMPGARLTGLAYVVLGDDGASSGVVEAIVSLDEAEIPQGGFLVGAEMTFSLGVSHLVASLNFENADNVTHLLVSGFTGASGQDLDADDDGLLDEMPWDQLLDCVALLDSATAGDRVYCETTAGPADGAVLGHAYRCAGDWRVGMLDPSDGNDTPGSENACAPAPTPTPSPAPTATATGVPSHIALSAAGLESTSGNASLWILAILGLTAGGFVLLWRRDVA
jgi:hypothetical protein